MLIFRPLPKGHHQELLQKFTIYKLMLQKTPILSVIKLQQNKNYPDNINKGLMKLKLVKEFQGTQRGGTMPWLFQQF